MCNIYIILNPLPWIYTCFLFAARIFLYKDLYLDKHPSGDKKANPWALLLGFLIQQPWLNQMTLHMFIITVRDSSTQFVIPKIYINEETCWHMQPWNLYFLLIYHDAISENQTGKTARHQQNTRRIFQSQLKTFGERTGQPTEDAGSLTNVTSDGLQGFAGTWLGWEFDIRYM